MKRITLPILLIMFCFGAALARPSDDDADVASQEEIVVKEEKKKERSDFAIPTMNQALVREVLKDKQKTRQMVDCVLDFDEDECPIELKNVNKMAPEIFRRGGRCYKCTKEDKKRLKQFLVDLQRSQPSEYRRLIRQLNKI